MSEREQGRNGVSEEKLREEKFRYRIRVEEQIAKGLLFLCYFISIALVGVVFIFLLKESFPVLRLEGWGFFTGRHWWVEEEYGALPMIYGTMMVTTIAVLFSVPLGLGSAFITSEALSGRTRFFVKSMMELLAGIPGVVYGLLGMVILTTAVRDAFGLVDGNTIFTAGILLGMMSLPSIMTFSDDAFQNVPREYRQQALALGMNRVETFFCAVFPNALKGVVGSIFLGMSRAMGETIAVMLVIGSLDRVPSPWYQVFQTGQTITSKLGRESAEALGVGMHWSALTALGLILFLMVMGITFLGDFLILSKRKTLRVKWGGSSK